MAYPKSRQLPWFMVPVYLTDTGFSLKGVSSNLIITTDTVPKEVKDTKQLNYHEQQIPGGYTSIFKYGSAGARKVSFQLEIADFNDDVGLGIKLAQFDLLRRPEINVTAGSTPSTTDPIDAITNSKSSFNPFTDNRYIPFHSNPYVFYYNSIFNTVPLPFQVLKCDFTT